MCAPASLQTAPTIRQDWPIASDLFSIATASNPEEMQDGQ